MRICEIVYTFVQSKISGKSLKSGRSLKHLMMGTVHAIIKQKHETRQQRYLCNYSKLYVT